MRIKYYFLFVIFLLFQSLANQLAANSDIDTIPFNEDAGRLAERRYTVKDVDTWELRHNDKCTLIQNGLKGRTFLRYNVSAENYSCLFHSIQNDRTLINRLIQAVETDHPRAQLIVDNLRSPILEKLATDDLNPDWARLTDPNTKITKAEVRGFSTPFARNGEFTPYEVALAWGALEGIKVHVWQDPDPNNRTKKLTLRGCTIGDFSEHLHIYYGLNSRLQPQGVRRAQGLEHFERLVLEGEPDVEYEKAKSLWIQNRIGTGRSSVLTDEELGLLRQKFPKPQVVPPQPQSSEPPKAEPQKAVSPPQSTPQPKVEVDKVIPSISKVTPSSILIQPRVETSNVAPIAPSVRGRGRLQKILPVAQPRKVVRTPTQPPVKRVPSRPSSAPKQQRAAPVIQKGALVSRAPSPSRAHQATSSSGDRRVLPSAQPKTRAASPSPVRPVLRPAAQRNTRQARPQVPQRTRAATPPARPVVPAAPRQARPAVQPRKVARAAAPAPARRSTIQQAATVNTRRPALAPINRRRSR